MYRISILNRVCIVYGILRIFVREIAIRSHFKGRPGPLGFLVGNNFYFLGSLFAGIIKFVFLTPALGPRKLQFHYYVNYNDKLIFSYDLFPHMNYNDEFISSQQLISHVIKKLIKT